MRVIHGSWLIEIERHRSRTILRLFCYDFTTVALLNDQPGVVGVNARPISKPAETDIRNEFVHQATDRESESLPRKFALRSADPHRHSLFEHHCPVTDDKWKSGRVWREQRRAVKLQTRPNFTDEWHARLFLVKRRSVLVCFGQCRAALNRVSFSTIFEQFSAKTKKSSDRGRRNLSISLTAVCSAL
jgi:hypothetical protein